MDKTLNSAFSPSQLDSTYTNDGDDSITIAKITARAPRPLGLTKTLHRLTKRLQKDPGGDHRPIKQYSVDDCNLKTGGSMTQCNLCMS